MARYSYNSRVKATLADLGKTQKDLARAIGYSPQYLSKVLNGTIQSPSAREAIRQALSRWKEERNGT